MDNLSQLMQLFRDEKAKWGNSPKLADLIMNDRSTQGIRDYAGNVQQRGATLAGLLQGREPTDAQKALFNIANPGTEQGAMDLGIGFVGSMSGAAKKQMMQLLQQAEQSGFPKGQLWRSVDQPNNKYLRNPDYNTGIDVMHPSNNAFVTPERYKEIGNVQKYHAAQDQADFEEKMRVAIEADARRAAVLRDLHADGIVPPTQAETDAMRGWQR